MGLFGISVCECLSILLCVIRSKTSILLTIISMDHVLSGQHKPAHKILS